MEKCDLISTQKLLSITSDSNLPVLRQNSPFQMRLTLTVELNDIGL